MRMPTMLVSLLLILAAGGSAGATVIPVPGGYEVTYRVNLANGTSNGNDIVDVVILEWDDSGQIHADLPFTIAGQGSTDLSHVVGFHPVSALVLGYGEGIPGVGDERDHVFSLTSSSFAAAATGVSWGDVFPGVTPDTRVRHSVMIELLRQATAGDGTALDAVVEFARTEGVQAEFDPAGRFRVMEWTNGNPIDDLPVQAIPTVSFWGVLLLSVLLLLAALRAVGRRPAVAQQSRHR